MLQTRTVEPYTLGLLKQLMSMPALNSFDLVGGTALALQLGHRFSVDLDLFTTESFDKEDLFEQLRTSFDLIVERESKTIYITYINEVKVDFVRVPYPKLFPVQIVENVRMLDIRDIAPMKLNAVAQRGNKKDFYDIYFLLKIMSLQDILSFYEQKFKNHTLFHVIKSLTYFEDAEKFPDPMVFDKKISWIKVKNEITKVVNQLL
jgi:predicted nucleotidyltransferase component of viral defense system